MTSSSSFCLQGVGETVETFQARLCEVADLRAEIKYLNMQLENCKTECRNLRKEKEGLEYALSEGQKEIREFKEQEEHERQMQIEEMRRARKKARGSQ